MAFWRRTKDLSRRAEFLSSQSFVVLSIKVPRDVEKSVGAFEQVFSALHGVLRSDPVLQEHFAFELIAKKDSIKYYLFCPIHLKDFIEGQLYAQFPSLVIEHVADYTQQVDLDGRHVATTEISLSRDDVYPIKKADEFEIDPLVGITATLGDLKEGEHLWFQITFRPISDDWQSRGVTLVKQIRSGERKSDKIAQPLKKVGRFVSMIAQELAKPGSAVGGGGEKPEAPKLSAPEEAALKGIEQKITKLGFEAHLRLVGIATTEQAAQTMLLNFTSALKQFNTTNLNGFRVGSIMIDDYGTWEQFINREFEQKGIVLNTEELASLYHFPDRAIETNAIARVGSRKGEAPYNLPLVSQVDPHDITLLGRTDYRSKTEHFGIKNDDRMRHIYVIGKSGSGKSTLLENMIIDDIAAGRGVIVIDPHGELVEKVLECVSPDREQDVVVFDPSDREFPVGFNLLDVTEGEIYKDAVASGFVSIFKKLFSNSWGPRLEYIMRNTVLALLQVPDATMLLIPRMLTEKAFQKWVVENYVTDPVVRNFWVNEWGAMDQKNQVEAIGPILNKVGQFLSTSTIRNIVGQPKSTIDIRKIMDEGKVLLVNLSKGKIGEDNSALLGAMVVTKVQLAAMSRADTAASERTPCFTYVDEFQNFATDSFATILSEARKYGLGLTVAHQYIGQLSEEVKDAVIGNVGSIILFRVGPPDAEALLKEFEPTFGVPDMINLERGSVYMKLLIDGQAAVPFSAQTMPPRKPDEGMVSRAVISARSRDRYARARGEVEASIDESAGYKRQRDAEEAAKKAAAALQQGKENGGVAPAPAPALQRPTPQMAAISPTAEPFFMNRAQGVVVEPTAKASIQPSEPLQQHAVAQIAQISHEVVVQSPQPHDIQVAPGVGELAVVKKPKVHVERPPKRMGDYIYRETSQRGGQRWFVAERYSAYEARKNAKSDSPNGAIPNRTETESSFTIQDVKPGE
jgi:ABC-type oligopeptide transport system ATPase subunit